MRVLTILFLLMLSFGASAQDTYKRCDHRSYSGSGGGYGEGITGAAACANVCTHAAFTQCTLATQYSPDQCQFRTTNTPGVKNASCEISNASCAAGTFYDDTTKSCITQCPPPQVWNATLRRCEDPPSCPPPMTTVTYGVGGCNCPVEGQVIDIPTNTCVDPPIECDAPQVPNETNDACIDPPLVCFPPEIPNELGDACYDPTPPECPDGQVYSDLWDQCHAPCEIPGEEWAPLGGVNGSCADPNPYNCPPGTSPRDVTAGQGESDSVGLIMCVDNQETTGDPEDPEDIDEPVTPDPPPVDCPEPDSIIGYINDQPVCGSVKESCDSVGGSLGIDAAGKPRCVPQKSITDDDAMPSCKSNETITYVSAAQEYRCKKVTDEPNTIPKSEKPPEIDTDNDGTPDQNDSDMDGDGIDNSLDDDWDGDGTPNVDDATPKGSSGSGTGLGGGENSITGGGNCEAKPECKGDPIECAVVFQTYKTRCAAESLIEDTEDEAGDYIKWSEISDNLDDEFDGYTDSLETGEDDQNTAEVNALESAVSGLLPDSPTCSDITINMLGYGDAVIACADLAIVRDIIGWALYIFTAWYLFQLAITPIESKV